MNGMPLTDTLVIKFISQTQAESQLINGRVDILGPETLRDVSTALLDAQMQGQIKVYPIPYAWEHADINLETYEVSAEISPTSGGALSYTNRLGSDAWVTIPAGTGLITRHHRVPHDGNPCKSIICRPEGCQNPLPDQCPPKRGPAERAFLRPTAPG